MRPIRDLAHQLKGSALAVGAFGLAAAAERVESAFGPSPSGQKTARTAAIEALAAELATALSAIEGHLKTLRLTFSRADAKTHRPKGPPALDFDASALMGLRACLRIFSPEAPAFRRIRPPSLVYPEAKKRPARPKIAFRGAGTRLFMRTLS